MICRTALLSACLFLTITGTARADKLALPLGEWGHRSSHGLACNPPFLKIEPNRIVKRLGGGEGRCPLGKIKKQGKALFVDAKCEYDKSIPEDYLISGDNDDESFSIEIKGPNKILFNNTPHELCRAASGGGQ